MKPILEAGEEQWSGLMSAKPVLGEIITTIMRIHFLHVRFGGA